MKRSPEEIAALKESFRKMTPAQKADYIFTYYKWQIIIGLIVVGILGNTLYRQVTKKETAVYCGLVNVSIGTDLEQALSQGYLHYAELNPKKNQVQIYSGLYLSDNPATEDHQYAYASRMKVMATVNAKILDVVLMNQESYDILSHSGYLLELSELSPAFAPRLVSNDVVLEENSIEVQLGEAEEYEVVLETQANALDCSDCVLFREAGFPEAVYVGIIANTPRTDATVQYLEYLIDAQ